MLDNQPFSVNNFFFNLLGISYLLRITTTMMTRITKITATTNIVDTMATTGFPLSSFSAESQSCGNVIKSKRFKEHRAVYWNQYV